MKTVTTARLLAACVLIVPATSACNRTGPETETTRTVPAAGATTEPRDDRMISTEVQAKFYSDEAIRGRSIDVSSQKGVVTLRGTVPTQGAKQQAVTVARGVEGVTSVNDQLEVRADAESTTAADRTEPAATGTAGREREETDAEGSVQAGWLTTKIQSQYFLNPEVKPWNIDVTSTSAGVVTLEGTVDDAKSKAEAVRIARETEGVTSVDDRLTVKPEGERGEGDRADAEPDAATPGRPDAWLTAKIQAKYFVDDEVKGHEIDVDTQNGVVTLKGTIATESQRRQAVALARNTEGVRSVTDQLQVGPNAAEAAGDGPKAKTIPAVDNLSRPDSWITMKIQSKYFLDTDVKGHRIDVDTRNGVVTLKGTVATADLKKQVEQIARDTEGVKRVTNQIEVGGAER